MTSGQECYKDVFIITAVGPHMGSADNTLSSMYTVLHNIGYQSQSQAWKLTVSRWSVDQIDADTSVVKTRMKSKGRWRRMNGKNTEKIIMEGERGKGDGYQHGR